MTAHDDITCPFCGHREIQGNGVAHYEGNILRDDLYCPECDNSWCNVYKMIGYESNTAICPSCKSKNIHQFDNDITSGRWECHDCGFDWPTQSFNLNKEKNLTT